MCLRSKPGDARRFLQLLKGRRTIHFVKVVSLRHTTAYRGNDSYVVSELVAPLRHTTWKKGRNTAGKTRPRSRAGLLSSARAVERGLHVFTNSRVLNGKKLKKSQVASLLRYFCGHCRYGEGNVLYGKASVKDLLGVAKWGRQPKNLRRLYHLAFREVCVEETEYGEVLQRAIAKEKRWLRRNSAQISTY